jgi:hypothetical protein
MAKKKTVGNVIELDLPPTPVVEPVVKKKKELSDKQRENLSKGMAILKAKREAKSKKEDIEVEPTPEPAVVPPPAPVSISRSTPSVAPPPAPVAAPEQPKKERKPRVVKNYLTTEDFNSFKSELLTSLKPNALSVPQTIVQREVVPVAQAQSVIKERVISGRELLDKIFFK